MWWNKLGRKGLVWSSTSVLSSSVPLFWTKWWEKCLRKPQHFILFLAFPTPLLFICSSGSFLLLSGPWLRFSLLNCHQIKDDRNKPWKYCVLINCIEHCSLHVVKYRYLTFLLPYVSHESWGTEGFPFKYVGNVVELFKKNDWHVWPLHSISLSMYTISN